MSNPRAKERFALRMAAPAMQRAVTLEQPFDDPVPAGLGGFDLITFFFYYHDTTYMAVDRAQMNRKLYDALKPGGMLVIADHSAKPGEGISAGKTLHRIEESVLRREVEAAGFKLVAEGDFLRHPEDTRDFSVNRPTGPVDEFVLKFQKPNLIVAPCSAQSPYTRGHSPRRRESSSLCIHKIAGSPLARGRAESEAPRSAYRAATGVECIRA